MHVSPVLHSYCFLHKEVPTAIHDQEQSLAVLPNNPSLQVMSPTRECGDYAAILPKKNKQSFDLQFRRGHHAAPIDSEVDDAQIVGMLASPLHMQEREASADPSRIYHSNE